MYAILASQKRDPESSSMWVIGYHSDEHRARALADEIQESIAEWQKSVRWWLDELQRRMSCGDDSVYQMQQEFYCPPPSKWAKQHARVSGEVIVWVTEMRNLEVD